MVAESPGDAVGGLKAWLVENGGSADVVVGPTQYGFGLLAKSAIAAREVVGKSARACTYYSTQLQ